MTTTKNLTAAAKRDLAKLQAGERVDLRYGPFEQLVAAGYLEGTQDNYRLVAVSSDRIAEDTARYGARAEAACARAEARRGQQ